MINLKTSKSLRSSLTLLRSSLLNSKRNVHQLNVVKLNRTLLNLKGPDTFQFLQGLISNDIRQFLTNFRLPVRQSIYSLLLQTNGRTLADFILYNKGPVTEFKQLGNSRSSNEFEGNPNHSVVLECDPNIKSNLIKILRMYKLKKNLELNEDNQSSVWCIYSPELKKFKLKEHKDDLLMLNKDPRLSYLGYRCLAKLNNYNQLIDQLKSFKLIDFSNDGYNFNEAKITDYIDHRYRLGIGEGILDNPSGQCLPLEDNADLLNGLDFNKGCYLGQELVARTFYTGVVRKRLLPIEVLKFKNQAIMNIEDLTELKEKIKFGITLHREDNVKKRLGKIRTISTSKLNLGLGLLYHKELENCNHLAANQELGLLVKVRKPIWWPNELN